VRRAYSAAQLAAGRRLWDSPDVLPWAAWLQRELDAARARGESLPRRLTAAEQWLLWRQSVSAACENLPFLRPDTLIEPVQRALSLLEDYGLRASAEASTESAVLLRAQQHYRRRCEELAALGEHSWRACTPWLQPHARVWLAGFASVGPARRAWLAQAGARVLAPADEPQAGAIEVRAAQHPLAEAQDAAQWCAQALERSSQARLLVVVPGLSQQRHVWERAFARQLDYEGILAGTALTSQSTFAIEGGQPLPSFALVASALQLLSLAAGQAEFEQLSALLRSAYLPRAERAERLRIDRWLREHNIASAEPALLQALLAPMEQSLGAQAAAVLRALLAAAAELPAPPARLTPARWAQLFAQLLARAGWPGAALNSDELQVRRRFDELLGELASISPALGAADLPQACDWLAQLAAQVAFEPATDDVPVTLSSSLDDPIVRYDGVWVAGLTADAWPQAARPDALLPLPLQLAAGVLAASAQGQLRAALEQLAHWRGAAGQCVLSWPRTDADLPRDPSPLLADIASNGAPSDSAAASVFELQQWMREQAPGLIPWRDDSGPAWPPERALRGGIRLLELQSLCPFRGFVEPRLQAAPLPEPAPGIDPRLRGQIVHQALESFWRTLRDSDALRVRGLEGARDLMQACIAAAIDALVEPALAVRMPLLLRREQARTEVLLQQLIDWELSREPFVTEALEWQQPFALAGATLQLRLDRVDRLADGRLLVLDYKSGTAQKFDPLAPRPPQPQLPIYATVAGARTAAVAALYLGREGVKLRGVADRGDRLPDIVGLKAGASAWPTLLADWRSQIDTLLQEFLRGEAAVRPQPGACDHCHLQMLCRVDPAALAMEQEPDTDEPLPSVDEMAERIGSDV